MLYLLFNELQSRKCSQIGSKRIFWMNEFCETHFDQETELVNPFCLSSLAKLSFFIYVDKETVIPFALLVLAKLSFFHEF